jgi:fructoselysine-6-P-deglycase FrlB-like protein
MSGFARAGCTATPPKSGSETSENAGKRQSINADVASTLTRLYTTASGSHELVAKPAACWFSRQSSGPVSGSAAGTAKAHRT